MVKIKNALYACAMYLVSVVGLYGFESVGGNPNKKALALGGSEVSHHHGRDLRQTISVHSDAQSLKGVGRGHACHQSRRSYRRKPLEA